MVNSEYVFPSSPEYIHGFLARAYERTLPLYLFHIMAAGVFVKEIAIKKRSRKFVTFPFRKRDERLQ